MTKSNIYIKEKDLLKRVSELESEVNKLSDPKKNHLLRRLEIQPVRQSIWRKIIYFNCRNIMNQNIQKYITRKSKN